MHPVCTLVMQNTKERKIWATAIVKHTISNAIALLVRKGPQEMSLGRHICRTKLAPKNFKIDAKNALLGGRFDIFYFFFCFGGGERRRSPRRKGWDFSFGNKGGGGFPRRGGGVVHTGAGRVSWGRGGGAKYFFSGPRRPPSLKNAKKDPKNDLKGVRKIIGGLTWPRVRHEGLHVRWIARLRPPQFCNLLRWTARRTPPLSERRRARFV